MQKTDQIFLICLLFYKYLKLANLKFMAGIEVRIPYINFSTKTIGFPIRYNAPATNVTVQKNFQYMGNKIKFTSSIEPLYTDSSVIWSIVDGSTYASINASTGELNINEGTITQMVKVRAQSVLNASIFDDREIVLTYKESDDIEQINFDIIVNGLLSEYVFADSSTSYSFSAQLDPQLDDYIVVFEILEGYNCLNITNMNFDNNITTTTFSFNAPEQEDQIISLRLYVDKLPEISKTVSFTVKTLISEILFDNIPESPYMPYNLYSFDYYTEPVVNFRNLDVSVISGNEYLYNYYKGEEIGTRGKFYFERNSLEIEDYEYITIRFSDPLDNTIYRDVSIIFDNINHNIDVSGNKALYQYNADKTFYESFTWTENPTYDRELEIIVTQQPSNIINYYTSDVSGGSGRFNFQTKSVTDEGCVKVRIQDPLTTLGKNVIFNIQNEKVARYMNIWDPNHNDTSYWRNVNAIAYGNNLQKAIRISIASPDGYDYFVYDTSDNNFWNETAYGKEPRAHYTSVNLFDTSLYMEYDYIPANTIIYNKDTDFEYRVCGGFSFYFPTVQYEFDSSRNINYPKTVDISTNLPAGTYAVFDKKYRDSSRSWYMDFDIQGQDNYMILDSSHLGNDRNTPTIVTNPIAIHSDIPHIKIENNPTSYSYFDPNANIVSTYFNNIQGNKEISISYVQTLRSVSPRPEDTDEYFYVLSSYDDIQTQKMTYRKYYAPTVIDYVRNNLHLSGNIAKILYNDTYTGNSFMDAVQIGNILNNMRIMDDPSLPYKMRIYPNREYDGINNNQNQIMQYEGFTSGLVSRIPAGTYDIAINYKADIVPIDYTINVKVNVS